VKHEGLKTNIAITQNVIDDLRAKGIDVQPVSMTGQRIAGIETELISAEAAERVEMVVCGYPPWAFPDEDLLAWCHDCQCAIVHRPHAPKTPVKVCWRCAQRRLIARAGSTPK
jgi:hypothetical protein